MGYNERFEPEFRERESYGAGGGGGVFAGIGKFLRSLPRNTATLIGVLVIVAVLVGLAIYGVVWLINYYGANRLNPGTPWPSTTAAAVDNTGSGGSTSGGDTAVGTVDSVCRCPEVGETRVGRPNNADAIIAITPGSSATACLTECSTRKAEQVAAGTISATDPMYCSLDGTDNRCFLLKSVCAGFTECDNTSYKTTKVA